MGTHGSSRLTCGKWLAAGSRPKASMKLGLIHRNETVYDLRVPMLESHLTDMIGLARGLRGHLTDSDVRFLALAAASLPPSLGHVLEIGSFMGKSTTVLAKSVSLAGGDQVIAVDPQTLPAVTDPAGTDTASLRQAFRHTLEANGLEHVVDFYRLRSDEFARNWNRPIRLLWIDGDHTYTGVAADFDNFSHYLGPGAVVAFHDVTNPFEGPLRVFSERVLSSSSFGACGICGSIGWAQFTGGSAENLRLTIRKAWLHRTLRLLVPLVSGGGSKAKIKRRIFRMLRSLVPRADVDPEKWVAEIETNIPRKHESSTGCGPQRRR